MLVDEVEFGNIVNGHYDSEQDSGNNNTIMELPEHSRVYSIVWYSHAKGGARAGCYIIIEPLRFETSK